MSQSALFLSQSEPQTVPQRLDVITTREEEIQASLQEFQSKVQQLYEEKQLLERQKTALQNFEENSPPVEQQKDISHKRKKYEEIKPEVRALVEDAVLEQGKSYEEVRVLFRMGKSSVSRIIAAKKKAMQGVSPAPKKKRGRKSELSADALIFLLGLIEKNSQITLQQMSQQLDQDRKIEVAPSTVQQALKKMHVTWKNVLPIPVDWNTYDTIKQRAEFVTKMTSPLYSWRPKIFIDESGFNLHIKKSKGRALEGHPAILTVLPKGKRISLIAALGEKGVVHHTLINSMGDKKRGVNAEDFRSFLLDLAKKAPLKSLFILDNCRIHHSEKLDALWLMLNKTFGIEAVYLPPYSPFLNPIEYMFNFLKTGVSSSQFFNPADLKRVIEQRIPSVSSEIANEFYLKSLQYYHQAALQLPFIGKPLDPALASNISSNAVASNNSNNNNVSTITSIVQM